VSGVAGLSGVWQSGSISMSCDSAWIISIERLSIAVSALI